MTLTSAWIVWQAASVDLLGLLSNPLVDKAFAVVIVFILLKFLREDIGKLTDAMTENSAELRAMGAKLDTVQQHTSSRMNEIREALRELIKMWATDRNS